MYLLFYNFSNRQNKTNFQEDNKSCRCCLTRRMQSGVVFANLGVKGEN